MLDSAHSWSGGSLRSRRRRLRFYNGDEAGDRITSFKQPSHLLDFLRVNRPFDDWGQEVQRLTAEKVHGTERFQKYRSRSSHAPFHHRISHPFKQREIFSREHFSVGRGRKCMGQLLTDLVPFFRRDALEKEVITVWKGSRNLLSSGII